MTATPHETPQSIRAVAAESLRLLQEDNADAAVEKALYVLDVVQADAVEREIPCEDFSPALIVIEKGSALLKTYAQLYRGAMLNPSGAVRYEQADTALRQIRRLLDE